MLGEIELEQDQVKIIYEDNDSTLLMANDQQLSRCTYHLDITYFLSTLLGSIRPYYPPLRHNAQQCI